MKMHPNYGLALFLVLVLAVLVATHLPASSPQIDNKAYVQDAERLRQAAGAQDPGFGGSGGGPARP